jgi:zinc finger BED domain-containing protein 5/7/8/9
LKKVISVTTDDAPAMIGAHQGFVQRLINDPKCNSDLLSYHCIIHQSVLCCKLDPRLEKIMKTVMSIVNFIRAKSSLQHRLFKALVQENDTQFDDLLLHNNVRWLSKGNVLQRFFNLLNEIELFLIQSTRLSAKDYYEFISDNSNIATIAFLTDIFQHINSFNLKLQGNQKLICHLVSEVNCFCRKIDFFLQDVGNDRLHFHNLKKAVDENHEIDMTNFTRFLESLKTEFERRFADFRKIKNVVQLLNSSFTLQPDGEWINEAKNVFNCNRAHLQMEIIEFQSDDVLKNLYNEKYSKTEIDSTYDEFWLKYVSEKKYPTLKLLTVKMCTMFGSTYVCESAFSKMNYIKNKFRSRLSNEHLEMMMKIATTNHNPDLNQLVESKICHFSH